MKKKKIKKPKYLKIDNCGGKKCGSAFEWQIIDISTQPKMAA